MTHQNQSQTFWVMLLTDGQKDKHRQKTQQCQTSLVSLKSSSAHLLHHYRLLLFAVNSERSHQQTVASSACFPAAFVWTKRGSKLPSFQQKHYRASGGLRAYLSVSHTGLINKKTRAEQSRWDGPGASHRPDWTDGSACQPAVGVCIAVQPLPSKQTHLIVLLCMSVNGSRGDEKQRRQMGGKQKYCTETLNGSFLLRNCRTCGKKSSTLHGKALQRRANRNNIKVLTFIDWFTVFSGL